MWVGNVLDENWSKRNNLVHVQGKENKDWKMAELIHRPRLASSLDSQEFQPLHKIVKKREGELPSQATDDIHGIDWHMSRLEHLKADTLQEQHLEES